MDSVYGDRAYPAGFPHSGIHGSRPAFGSPWLFADCCALLRLPVPRHPPCALSSLTKRTYASHGFVSDSLLRSVRIAPIMLESFLGSSWQNHSLPFAFANSLPIILLHFAFLLFFIQFSRYTGQIGLRTICPGNTLRVFLG